MAHVVRPLTVLLTMAVVALVLLLYYVLKRCL
jgi:hypothetical protein